MGEKIININDRDHLYLNYDNIGMQSGGWSLRWQGFMGNGLWQGDAKTKSNASSIMDGLVGLKQNVNVFIYTVPNGSSQLY